MSSPDEPTRRVPAARPRAAREPVPPEDPALVPPPGARTWEEDLLARITNVRNWLIVTTVIAIAALGAAIYAIVDEPETRTTSNGGNSARVADLEDRVSALEDDAPSSSDINQLNSQVDSLSDRVDELDDGASSSDLDQLSNRIDQLEQQVNDLQSQSTQ